LLQWLDEAKPDIVALQETKLSDDKFPHMEIEAAGYHAVCAGQKAYNGVALLSRIAINEVLIDIPGLGGDERRIIAATTQGVRLLNLYVVNGQEVGSEKYERKLQWLAKVRDWLSEEMKRHEQLIVLGDFNITPDDRDVYDPKILQESILCSSAERAALQQIIDLGLTDTFRLFAQEPGIFSWWDYRQGAFRRNMGLRIDLILASKALADKCTAAYIDKGPRKLERPSDHAPVLAEFQFA
jgi:exodeoxyribonuclease-3